MSSNNKELRKKSQPSVSGSSSSRIDSYVAQERIKELESQVSELKHRLDELRKAKNQTFIKKDKEYVSMGGDSHVHRKNSQTSDKKKEVKGSDQPSKQAEKEIIELKDEIDRLKQSHVDEVEKLKIEIDHRNSEILQLKKENEQLSKRDVPDPELNKELERLRQENITLKQNNENIQHQNEDLQCRIDDLLEELSQKEAQWCNKEEKLKIELRRSWGEKYHEWMVKTEAKIKELQAANDFLKVLLEKQQTDNN